MTVSAPKSMSPTRRAWIFALSLGAIALACAPRAVGPPAYLHVIVQRLPQCDYGIGFEQPLRIDLLRRRQVLATSWHSGVNTGESSLDVPFHVEEALPGRYTIRFGRCPSLIDDPAGAAACEDVDWVARHRVRLVPRGARATEAPVSARDQHVGASAL